MEPNNINLASAKPIWGSKAQSPATDAIPGIRRYNAENPELEEHELEYLSGVSKALETGLEGVLIAKISKNEIGISLSEAVVKELNGGKLPDIHAGGAPFFYDYNRKEDSLNLGNITIDLKDKKLSALNNKIQEVMRKRTKSTKADFIANSESKPNSFELNIQKVAEQLDPNKYNERREAERKAAERLSGKV